MEAASQLIFGIGALLFVSVLASRVSDRIGAPLLLVFLLLGMLLGEDGPGGLAFGSRGDHHAPLTIAKIRSLCHALATAQVSRTVS